MVICDREVFSDSWYIWERVSAQHPIFFYQLDVDSVQIDFFRGRQRLHWMEIRVCVQRFKGKQNSDNPMQRYGNASVHHRSHIQLRVLISERCEEDYQNTLHINCTYG